MAEYRTVAAEASAEIEVKKSHFIGHIAPVVSPQEANAFLARIKDENKKARHNVHAYRLADGKAGFSDDGEPQGTAGKPLLDVIGGAAVVNTVIVVTRYFGGILLGTGGLVRAYGAAAKLALEAARIVAMQSVVCYTTALDYTYYGRVSALIPACGGEIENTVYQDTITLLYYIPEAEAPRFLNALSELTYGAVAAVETGRAYRQKPADNRQ
ncbi:MAG: YigZ family protein [Clostridia bacterium]|nr:YigZ family protein [Clostridia bacterium]